MKTKNPQKESRSTGTVTMLDVAEYAGVSAQTVSRVVSNSSLVTDKTRRRVEEAIQALRYIPNEAARSLASASSRVVAVIIPTLSSTAFAAEVKSVIDTLEPHKISVIIGNTEYSQEREEAIVQSLLERRPMGVILTGLQHSAKVRSLLQESGVAVIETWDTDGEPIDMAVGFSNFTAGYDVGKLLCGRGAKQIAFVGGASAQDSRAESRYLGLCKAVKEAKLPAVLRVELQLPMNASDGVRGLDEVLRDAPMTDAIFFSADTMALAAILECNRRGIKVPEQLAICGFGDYELAAMITPSLTTVRTKPDEMGATAAQMLLARINEVEDAATKIVLTHQLVRRGSA
ncbi:transcriptional regulator, LacI family [Paraburkholderia fungorum]|uniref:Transcriptional regulator, LacI family n=1 Tax=Paraburkholderia fungorum TaxID=134537 RepID=A0A1H1JB52_9BURK|nr:LacI family DNA-binding transcriptional regulator [Paraburkholderia fungorum]SDR47212.1 transcriptional regulator, LacI family [Paraburkholderia fungorum]